MTCSPGERSKATLRLGLEEDYHSPDRPEGEGTPERGPSHAKAAGCRVVCQERASEGAGVGL